jgi:hypothetical protein
MELLNEVFSSGYQQRLIVFRYRTWALAIPGSGFMTQRNCLVSVVYIELRGRRLFRIGSGQEVSAYDKYTLCGQFSSLWKKLWKLSLPLKMRIFLWKVCHGILPVCENLRFIGVFM